MRIPRSTVFNGGLAIALPALAMLMLFVPSSFTFGQRRAQRDLPKPIKERFKTMEGFEIEQVLGTEAGSIVAMTFNEGGNIIVSTEGGPLRLVRLTAAGTAASEVTLFCDQLTNCQGILCYKGYIFAVGNGPSGTAFYRLQDKNGDGTIDKTNDTGETLFKFKGGMGEHGPHQPVVGPDGLIYLMVGNHAWYGGEPIKSSPHHHYYEGDLFRPRYEDANGHAAGIPAPGGQVYRSDVDGKNVELFCSGFRNAYDLAFNRDGELFTYDSDMEWDIGLPWYRPTRVNHLVPGGEYGWRSGSMKWPDYYVDSLGATIDLGRGSPTGVMFYEGSAYPEEFRGDMLLCDWSRGYVIGVNHNREGATYVGEQYIFVEGCPLNVSDIEMGPDNNVYFCTGGRGTQGGIFRVTHRDRRGKKQALDINTAWGRAATERLVLGREKWLDRMHEFLVKNVNSTDRPHVFDLMLRLGGKPSTELLTSFSNGTDADLRTRAAYAMGLRNDKETAGKLVAMLDDTDPRVRRIACESLVRAGQKVPAEKLLKLLADNDRFVAWAARRGVEQLPKDEWQAAVLKSDQPKAFNRGSVALLVLEPERETCKTILQQCCLWSAKKLSDDDRLELYRVMQLALVRGSLKPGEVRFLGSAFPKAFPAKDWRLNREAARLLIYLQSPNVADKIVEQLESAELPEMEKRHLAFWTVFLKAGWTAELRDKLLTFYAAQQRIEGQGNSFRGYWANVSRDFMKDLSPEEKLVRIRSGAANPLMALSLVRALEAPLSAEQLAALRKLDEQLQSATGNDATELAQETLVALARSGDEEAMTYIHQVFDTQPERKPAAARAIAQFALAKERRPQDWDLLIRSLTVVEGETARQVLQSLARFEPKDVTPQMTRQVILLGLKLRRQGAQQASGLLRRWTGERIGGFRQPPEQTMAAWQKWFAEKYPDQPEARLPVDSAANKYTLDQLMEHLVTRGEHGDPNRGAVVFEKAQCIKCHKYGDRGEGIGPDLTNVSKRFQRKEILESVLYPSQVISDQFAGKTVTTSGGLQYTGLVAEQGGTLVVLTTTGEKINLNKSDVEEVAPNRTSAMPDGLFANLSLEEVSDLFAYLSTSEPPADSTSQPTPAAGWIELFNGRDLTGWVIEGTKENKKGDEPKPIWSVQDGLIHCEGDGFGFLRYDREFCDFVLHAEYRLTKGCNSGIGIRHAKFTGRSQTRPSFSGYEVQLLDDGGRQPNKGSSMSLYRYVAPKSLPVKKPDEWNTVEIECRGPRIKITLNGELVQDVDQSTLDDIKDKPLCGYISVQNHGKTIDFRNLRMKELR